MSEKKAATNEFSKGLNLDLNPISQPSNSLSYCLNGTLITYDGNEFNLQNDMGNYSLKGCELKQGFVPIGIASYGDIIYIASVNPDTNCCELGSYPSPIYPTQEELDAYSSNLLNKYEQYYIDNLKLENNYKPFWNYVKNGIRGEFTTPNLNFDLEHPVNIEVQPSYDGSVNLILNDDKNFPRLINSGFSIYENSKVRLVKRDQKEATNIYLDEKFKIQTKLKKISETIPRFKLRDVVSTGQLKGGNYTFYLKMADGDFNKSEILAESGQISVFLGDKNSINSITGTLLNENTDKAIKLRIENIDLSYTNFYILYSREFSDMQGVRQYEVFELTKPFEITDNEIITNENGEKCFDIEISGIEDINQISEEELNIEYIPIDAVKTHARQQSMLFLGNIHSDNISYRALQEIAYKTKVTLVQNTSGIGWVNGRYDIETPGSEYYNPVNIYNYLGYWPEEYYRFGVVFIRDDDTTTPAFKLIGKAFSSIGDNNSGGLNISESEWESSTNNNYILGSPTFYNRNGVFKNPSDDGCRVVNYSSKNVYPWYYQFQIDSTYVEELKTLGIKGYFFVRQKRVPSILCQGMSISIDKTSHTPMLYDPNYSPTQFCASDCNIPRFFNGDMYFTKDSTSDGPIPNVLAKPSDYYFSESFLAVFWDRRIIDSSMFSSSEKRANWHVLLVADGKSPLEAEKYDRDYTALGDHIIRTDASNKQCSAILSLDPCVIPELQTQLNGTERLIIARNKLKFKPIYTTENKTTSKPKYTVEEVTNMLNQIKASAEGWKTVQNEINEKFSQRFELFLSDGYDFDWGIFIYTYKKMDCAVYSQMENLINAYNPETEEDIAWKEKVVFKFSNPAGCELYNSNLETAHDAFSETINYDESGGSWIGGNVFLGQSKYYTRAFVYDEELEQLNKTYNNKVIFINSGNASKSIPNPVNQNKSLVFTTQAGDPADVSKAVLFGEGPKYRKKLYGAQFKFAVRGIFSPILGIDDVGKGNYPFLTDNTIYNIYTDNYQQNNQVYNTWFNARSQDNSPFYAVSDRYIISDTLRKNIYRGDCFTNTVTLRINRNFIDPEVPIVNEILNYATWATNVQDGFLNTDKEAWANVNRADVNAVSLGMWVTFKCMSNYNLGIRSVDRQHTDEMALMGNERSFFPHVGISAECGQKIEDSWLLNSGYNSTVGRKLILLNQTSPYQKTDYSNRVMFSNIAVKDSFSNGYRVFQGASYRDIDNQYGEITKLLPWGNNLFCVFEHGCAIIPVNEKALMQTTTEQTVHIYGYGVLPDQLSVISQDFGSIWADSIISTPLGIYGVDSSAKKVWRYTDSKGFETISDMVVQRFLNDNLLVTESDKSTNILTRNIKTHYNAYKGDVMFTFIKDSFTWNLCYNERQGMWITKYSWMPVYSENINNQFYSFGLDQAKEGTSKLYLHGRTGVFDEIDYMDNNPNNQLKPTKWYDKQEPFEFEFVVTQDIGLHKVFDNLILISNNVQPESIQFELIGDTYLFNKARLYHDAQEGVKNIYKNTDDGFNKENLRGTIANPYTPLETKYLKNAKIQYDPILDQYELVMNQETKNMETFGRRLGNIHYKEDAWYIVFDPIVFDENINSQSVEQTSPKWKTVPLRDKWLKIRIKYRGDQLAIITALNTIYRLTSS